uniref:Nuclear envelope phosphatase-regulatory subunit 1 n=1 Tax=Gadus morhua TaxID=8049 RepID=A0A8C5AT48_GADMO
MDKMNLDEFFKRIGFSGPFEKPDQATLNAIHKRIVMTVPFENLSIHCGEKIGMDHKAIFNKIVREQRGGWCMEGNYLLAWVLRELGYDSVMLGARVTFGNANDPSAPESHLINMVTIDGRRYIADVSFGLSFQIWEPIELVSGKDHTEAAGVFRLIDQDGLWFFEKTSRKQKILNPDLAKSDLKAFERRLTEYVSCLQPATGRWRMILIVVSVCTATGAWNWLIDPDTQKVSFFSSLWNHPFFTISCITLIALFFAGIHKRVVAPSIIAARCRTVLAEYNMSCDDTGKLILKPRPNPHSKTFA